MGAAESMARGLSRRERLAAEILDLVAAAIAAPGALRLELAGPGSAATTASAGATPAGKASTATRVVVNGPDALARLLWPPSGDALGEAYLRGDIDIDGDIWAAIEAGQSFDLRRLGRRLPGLARRALELRHGAGPAPDLHRRARLSGRRHSPARDMAAVRFHYDVGNEFYELWLDRRLTYSCAWFETPEASLDDAQEAKLDLICRKLRLAPGQRLLDIGCGWGSLVTFAAERYAVDATGITLSEPQARWALAEIGRRGLAEHAHVAVRDYRDLRSLRPFDAIASVGMFEHVGRANLARYFGAAFGALRPGGLFVNHGIATTTRRPGRLPFPGGFRAGGFVGRYVFPDGELVTIEEAVEIARRAGFEVLDVQSLRPHYALTLAAWVRRLEASATRARELVDEEVYRTWRLYMAAARRGFEDASLDVAQVLLARPGPGGPAELPLRPWWWNAPPGTPPTPNP